MKRLILLVATCGTAAAAAPQLNDFFGGAHLVPGGGQPVQELELPDEAYRAVTRADLGDLRVFNGAGIVVPHALCTAPLYLPAAPREVALPVYPLNVAARRRTFGVEAEEVRIQSPQGTTVVIRGPQDPATGGLGVPPRANPDTAGYVLDATGIRDPIRRLRFSWSAADGASELAVRVEASEDLDAWRAIVPQATLLRVEAGGRVLERADVALPEGSYRYLRVARSDSGPAPQLDAVTAEVLEPRRMAEPRRFVPEPVPERAPDGALLFDARRLAPVHEVRVHLPATNMRIEVALDSRPDVGRPWQERWRGDASSITAPGGSLVPTTALFPSVSERHWRLRVLRGAETLGTARPSLEFGYHPARVQFTAQGSAPWVLAWGGARVPRAETADCGALLSGLSDDVLGHAQVEDAPAARFGGLSAYAPPPPPSPLRRIVLWAVLIAGTLALVAMAASLMKKLRPPSA
jgi:hypothetical protein